MSIDGVEIKKKIVQSSAEEELASVGNSRVLNALFTTVNEEQFKLIPTCETAMEA